MTSVVTQPRRTLLLASNNDHKLRELRAMLPGDRYCIVSPGDLGLSLDVAETGATFAENATLKAEAFRDAGEVMSMADDSGLQVDVLDGAPGIYSARFGGPALDDAGRNALLLEQLSGIPWEQRTARFVSVIALAVPGGGIHLFEGQVEGIIAFEPAGNEGFGYDPVFYYAPAGRTFGQLTPEEKAAVSHRGRAVRHAVRYLLDPSNAGILDQS